MSVSKSSDEDEDCESCRRQESNIIIYLCRLRVLASIAAARGVAMVRREGIGRLTDGIIILGQRLLRNYIIFLCLC